MMQFYKKLFSLLLMSGAMFFPVTVKSQQLPQYTQYVFNTLSINPAYAGTKGTINTNALHRVQWSGINGAPTTQSFLVDAPLSGEMGVGGYIINDRIGLQQRTELKGVYSYKLKTGENSILSFGVAAGAKFASFDFSRMETDEPETEMISRNQRRVNPSASAGAFFYTPRFYAGLSLLEVIPEVFDNNIPFRSVPHYFFTTGYVFDLVENIKLKPSLLVKDDLKGPMSLDLNLFFLFYDRVWIGSSYRTGARVLTTASNGNMQQENLQQGNALALILEIYATTNLRIGYAYDITTTALSNFGTHEVSIGFSFLRQKESPMITPRYF
jgi:type IX secretion system PorP/SprF family membrane protein